MGVRQVCVPNNHPIYICNLPESPPCFSWQVYSSQPILKLTALPLLHANCTFQPAILKGSL